FTGLAAETRGRINLSDDANMPDSYTVSRVTSNVFSVIGLPPILGRAFTPEDETPGAQPVAILTYDLWDRRYGRDTSIIGRTIGINAEAATVVGVGARGLAIPVEIDLWTPYVADGKEKRQDRNFTVFGKLTPGVSREAANAEISMLGRRLVEQYPDANKDLR